MPGGQSCGLPPHRRVHQTASPHRPGRASPTGPTRPFSRRRRRARPRWPWTRRPRRRARRPSGPRPPGRRRRAYPRSSGRESGACARSAPDRTASRMTRLRLESAPEPANNLLQSRTPERIRSGFAGRRARAGRRGKAPSRQTVCSTWPTALDTLDRPLQPAMTRTSLNAPQQDGDSRPLRIGDGRGTRRATKAGQPSRPRHGDHHGEPGLVMTSSGCPRPSSTPPGLG